ncbi:hypothetical protein QOZ80_7AG0560980 [Eleusine coracana subsp. coracana]|nr:hypothetical protein QOZ80_7AG0560980 [Eleusine coracana subsp. coracana]
MPHTFIRCKQLRKSAAAGISLSHEQRMMSSSKPEGPKLFSSRILSRDRSNVANASFRVYYSLGAGTVPFVWESKPGTPKSAATPASTTNTMPPISPPPSYQSMSHQSKVRKSGRRAASWAAGRWISWLSLNIRRRSPASPTDHRQQWLEPDSGIDERQRRCSTSCF